MPKMSANVYVIEDYKNETAIRPKKQTQFKPNFRKAKIAYQKIWPHPAIFIGFFLLQEKPI